MIGVGSQPFGSSSFGIGVPALPNSLDRRIYLDPRTGRSLDARRIDAVTRDYVINEYGQYEGMSGTMQLVQMAVSTRKGSSAMRELGHDLDGIEVITSGLKLRVETTLTEAVSHIVNAGLITVLGVSMFLEGRDGGLQPGQVHTRFRFRDLRTNTDHDLDI